MKDILNREIPEGSFVIGMVIGRYSDGMRFGVTQGEHVVWRRWGLMKSKPSNVYLVEHPSARELEIKQEILDELHKQELEREAQEKQRKELKRIPMKQLVTGGYYTDDKGNNWCYLGKATVKTKITDGYHRVIDGPEEKHGYCYVRMWKYAKTSVSDVVTLKQPKKLVDTFEPEEERKIDISNLKEVEEGYDGYHRDYIRTTEVIYA